MTEKQITRIEAKLDRIISLALRTGAENAGPFDLESAAKYLEISKSHLYQLTSKNLIAHFKPAGKKIYFDKADLDEYLRRNRIRPQWEAESAAARA
ncbi:MAG: helix-turn-helix domain-containing protein [Acidobacteriia bacterium]|nr:helix-turn-helix domain-containing protein [Terriglobia bacterium]